MLDINLTIDDIIINSVCKEDIKDIEEIFLSDGYVEKNKLINYEYLYERFLEYYLTEGEFFLKFKNSKEYLIGFIKGRVEFKDPNIIWVNCLIIHKNFRGKGIGSYILNNIINFFKKNYDVKVVYTGVRKDELSFSFWKKNKFTVLRVSKEFYDINEKKKDMIVLVKNLKHKL